MGLTYCWLDVLHNTDGLNMHKQTKLSAYESCRGKLYTHQINMDRLVVQHVESEQFILLLKSSLL